MSKRSAYLRGLVAAAGLACWMATLPLYSFTISPFQRFDSLGAFVATYAWQMHVCCLAALALAALASRRRPLGTRMLLAAGGASSVAADAAFSLLATGALDAPSAAGTWALSALTGVGGALMALAWGRMFGRLEHREALGCIALAAALHAGLCVVLTRLPGPALAAAFCLVSAAAVGAACALGAALGGAGSLPGGEARPAEAGEAANAAGAFQERLASFVSVAGPAVVGLMAFAFTTGTMRGTVVGHHAAQVASLLICAGLLGWFALAPHKRSLAQMAYRNLIPLLAVLALAVSDITHALGADGAAELLATYTLYTLAALLTMSTLCGMAHAGEFPSDAIFSAALALFDLASLAGLGCSELMSEQAVQVATIVITALYALAMAVPSLLARPAAPDDAVFSASPGWPGGHAAVGAEAQRAGGRGDSGADGAGPGEGVDGGTAKDPEGSLEERIDRRCAELAAQARLTAREAQVLRLLALGHGSAYVSETLYISPNTVRTHVHNLYGKLGVGSREEIIRLTRG